jgi:hypothetical protein
MQETGMYIRYCCESQEEIDHWDDQNEGLILILY